eukprot:Gb_01825 [translate_table: standard]
MEESCLLSQQWPSFMPIHMLKDYLQSCGTMTGNGNLHYTKANFLKIWDIAESDVMIIGGVGKSTVAVNLAYTLAGMGARVGIFDADVYGPSLPTMVSPENRLLQMVPETKCIIPTEYLGVKLVSFGFAGQGRAIMRGPMVSGVINQLLTTTEWYEIKDMKVKSPSQKVPEGPSRHPLRVQRIVKDTHPNHWGTCQSCGERVGSAICLPALVSLLRSKVKAPLSGLKKLMMSPPPSVLLVLRGPPLVHMGCLLLGCVWCWQRLIWIFGQWKVS